MIDTIVVLAAAVCLAGGCVGLMRLLVEYAIDYDRGQALTVRLRSLREGNNATI